MGRRETASQTIPCHITRTNSKTHDIIRSGLDRSPLYSGLLRVSGRVIVRRLKIKIVRFADKDTHQIFVEPEGLDTNEIYQMAFSTSLPFDVQYEFVRSMLGFENAESYVLAMPLNMTFLIQRFKNVPGDQAHGCFVFCRASEMVLPVMKKPPRKV